MGFNSGFKGLRYILIESFSFMFRYATMSSSKLYVTKIGTDHNHLIPMKTWYKPKDSGNIYIYIYIYIHAYKVLISLEWRKVPRSGFKVRGGKELKISW